MTIYASDVDRQGAAAVPAAVNVFTNPEQGYHARVVEKDKRTASRSKPDRPAQSARSRRRPLDPRSVLGPQALEQVAALFGEGLGLTGRHVPGGKTVWGRRFGRFNIVGIARVLAGDGTDTPEVLAMRFGPQTRYGLLDIDLRSPYRTRETYGRLAIAASGLGLAVTLCRSSDSGGWHVYLWSSERIPIAAMHSALAAIARLAGIASFEDGICEIYPNPAKKAKAVRLPGQPGFAWLDGETAEPEFEYSATDVARRFLHLIRWAGESAAPAAAILAVSSRQAPQRVTAKPPRGRPPLFREPPIPGAKLPPRSELRLQAALVYSYDRKSARLNRPDFASSGAARFLEGAKLYESGLQRTGSRNTALLRVSFFLYFVGYTNPAVREKLLLRWMAERHNGLSSEWSDPSQRSRVEAEIHRLAHWPSASGVQKRNIAANQARSDRSRAKLAEAERALDALGERVTYRKITEMTGLSAGTIAKYRRGPAEDKRAK